MRSFTLIQASYHCFTTSNFLSKISLALSAINLNVNGQVKYSISNYNSRLALYFSIRCLQKLPKDWNSGTQTAIFLFYHTATKQIRRSSPRALRKISRERVLLNCWYPNAGCKSKKTWFGRFYRERENIRNARRAFTDHGELNFSSSLSWFHADSSWKDNLKHDDDTEKYIAIFTQITF